MAESEEEVKNLLMRVGFAGGSHVKESVCNARYDPWVRKIPWKREWLPIPVFLPGEVHESERGE